MKHTNSTSLTLIASTAMMIAALQAIASEGVPTMPDEIQTAEVSTATEAEASETGVVVEVVEEAEAATDTADLKAEEVEEAEVSTDTIVPETEEVVPPVADDAPTSMDRSGWPTIVVTPADGSVTHNPHYMGNPPLGEDIVSPLDAPDPVWQIQEALRGAEAGNLNGENLAALGAQPFIALARMALIPFRAVIEHPWAEVTTP